MLGTTFAENYVKKMIQAVELSFDVMTVGGMSGRMLVAAEDPCPSVLPAPYQLGEDISPNGVVCANFKYAFPTLCLHFPVTCDLIGLLCVYTQQVSMHEGTIICSENVNISCILIGLLHICCCC